MRVVLTFIPGAGFTKPLFNDKSADSQSEARISVAYNKNCHLSLMRQVLWNYPLGSIHLTSHSHKENNHLKTRIWLSVSTACVNILILKCATGQELQWPSSKAWPASPSHTIWWKSWIDNHHETNSNIRFSL